MSETMRPIGDENGVNILTTGAGIDMNMRRIARQSTLIIFGFVLIWLLVLLPSSPAHAWKENDAFDLVSSIVVQFIVQSGTLSGKLAEQTQLFISPKRNEQDAIMADVLIPLIVELRKRYRKQWADIANIVSKNRHCFSFADPKAQKRNLVKSGKKEVKSGSKACIASVMTEVKNILKQTDIAKWLETQLGSNDDLRYALYDTVCNSFILVDMKKSTACRQSILVTRTTQRSGLGVTNRGVRNTSKSMCVVKGKSDKTTAEECVEIVYQHIRNQFPMSWQDKCEAQVRAYRDSGRGDLADLLMEQCFPVAKNDQVEQGALTFRDTESAQLWGNRAFAAWYARLTPAERDAIMDYTASEYGPLNQCLRKNNCTDEQWALIAKINNALMKSVMPNTVVVHRTGDHGILREQSQAAKSDDTLQSIVRKEFTTPGFMSTGLVGGRNGATNGSNIPVEIVLTIPKQTRGCAYVGMISDKPEEAEVLCANGKKAIITKVEKVRGRLIVYANML
jgi:hypothetical protein